MSYEEDVQNLLNSFTDDEKQILRSKLGIDLFDLQNTAIKYRMFVPTRKRIVEIERRAFKKSRPDEYIEPEGSECSFCNRTENEVKVMAKHDSNYNICSECIDSCLQIIRSGDINSIT